MIDEYESKLKQKNSKSKALLGEKRKLSESHSKSIDKSKKGASIEKYKSYSEQTEVSKRITSNSKAYKAKSASLKSSKEITKNEKPTEVLQVIDQKEIFNCAPLYVIHLDIFLDGRLSVLVRWESKETSAVPYDSFKKQYPQKLLDYFESRIVFPFDNSGTKIFKETHKPKEEYIEDTI